MSNHKLPFYTGGKFCGNTGPSADYTTTDKSMTVYFQSDGSDQFSGFNMIITAFHTGEHVMMIIIYRTQAPGKNERLIPDCL